MKSISNIASVGGSGGGGEITLTEVDITQYKSINNLYIAPADGYVFIEAYGANSNAVIHLYGSNDTTVSIYVQGCGNGTSAGRATGFVKKGMRLYYETSAFGKAKFYIINE